MKKIYILIILLCFGFISVCFASQPNPFTTKSGKQHFVPKPPTQSKFFIKIISWQQQLKAKMSSLMRKVKTKKSPVAFFILFGSAFAYGVIHSAGPGHGKAVALSYILSCKPNLFQGLCFGNLMAFTHGFSGIGLVFMVKYILHNSMSASLDAITNITQIISFSLITCLGLFIFFQTCHKWIKRKTSCRKPGIKFFANPLFTAVAVGIIPCPGVVMVMLFAMSLDLTWLGIMLGASISFGMALTISMVVITGMSGKAAVFSALSKRTQTIPVLEHAFEALAGLIVACLGLIFLFSSF